ncbi:MAG: hypothetical protein FJX77_05665 [Armatimonadetes bacterium]|nr:hypothetical protein [Armatimonadota bacterium]
MESYAIPGPLKFLLTGGPMPPEAAAYFPEKPAVVVPGLEKYSHDQIRQAVALLEQMNTASTQHPVGVNLPAPEAMPKPDPLNMLDAMPAPSAPLGDLLGGPAKSVKVKVGKT